MYQSYGEPRWRNWTGPIDTRSEGDMAIEDYVSLLDEASRLGPKDYYQPAGRRDAYSNPRLAYAGTENIFGTPRGYDYLNTLNRIGERQDWARENEYQRALIAQLDEDEKLAQQRYAQTGSRQNVSSFAPNSYGNGRETYVDPFLIQAPNYNAKEGQSPMQWMEKRTQLVGAQGKPVWEGPDSGKAWNDRQVLRYEAAPSAVTLGNENSPNIQGTLSDRPSFSPFGDVNLLKGEQIETPGWIHPGSIEAKSIGDFIRQDTGGDKEKQAAIKNLVTQLAKAKGVDPKVIEEIGMPEKGKKMGMSESDKAELISDLMKPGPDGKPAMEKGPAIFYANRYIADPHSMPEPIKRLLEKKWYKDLPGAPQPPPPRMWGRYGQVHPDLVGKQPPLPPPDQVPQQPEGPLAQMIRDRNKYAQFQAEAAERLKKATTPTMTPLDWAESGDLRELPSTGEPSPRVKEMLQVLKDFLTFNKGYYLPIAPGRVEWGG